MLGFDEKFRDQQLANLLNLNGNEFRVIQVLQGGMGSVAKIEDEGGRVFALKLLDFGNSDPEIFERFRREVQVWVTASSCEAVVQVLGTLRINESPVVCAKWMSGGDLSRLMKSTDPNVFYCVLDRVVAGLEWVHANYKIVHRDLKPSNILLNEQDEPFISDWGIGKVELEGDESRDRRRTSTNESGNFVASLTGTGQILGTIAYCSPEQILSSAEVDFRSDIYSLGCLMFEWEAGRPPFLNSQLEEIARQHLQVTPPKIGGLFGRSKFGADSVIYRCLQKRPDHRFSTYRDLREALRFAAERKGIRLVPTKLRGRKVPLVGRGEIVEMKPEVLGSKGYGLVESEEVEGYLVEAEALMSVREWRKAYEILVRFWIPDFYPDGSLRNVANAVNLALCLIKLSRSNEAIEVLRTIPDSQRTADVYVNWTNAQNHLNRFSEAESIGEQGLKCYPDDCDLLGNLTIALIGQGKNKEALPIAKKRLTLDRNVHSLEEAGVVLRNIGSELFHSDFPQAIEYLSSAVELLGEALTLNPYYAPARLNLARTLFTLELYSDALAIASKLPDGPVYGLNHAILHAECLNRVQAAAECLKLCAECKKQFPNETRLLRVESETMADFYFVGMETKEGEKVVIPECIEFFRSIVADENKRQLSDFGYLTRIEEWLGSDDRAWNVAKQAHSIYGDRWEIFFRYARFLGIAGDWRSAYLNSKRACELARWHPPVWAQRKWIEEQLGLAEAAQSSAAQKQDLLSKKGGIRNALRDRFRSKGIIV